MKTIAEAISQIDKKLISTGIMEKDPSGNWNVDKAKAAAQGIWTEELNKEIRENKHIQKMIAIFCAEMMLKSLISPGIGAEEDYGMKCIHMGILIGNEMLRDSETTTPKELIRYIQALKNEGIKEAIQSPHLDKSIHETQLRFELGEQKIKIAQRLEEFTKCLFKK